MEITNLKKTVSKLGNDYVKLSLEKDAIVANFDKMKQQTTQLVGEQRNIK